MANGSGAGAELDRNWLDNLSDEELVDTFLARSKNDRHASVQLGAPVSAVIPFSIILRTGSD